MQREIKALMLQIMKNQNPQPLSIFNLLDKPSSQLNILNSSQYGTEILQMALGDTVRWAKTDEGLAFGSIDVTPRITLGKYSDLVSLASYFPPEDTNNNVVSSLSTFDMPGIPPQLVALQHFLQHFIVLTSNHTLSQTMLFNVVDWMLKNIDASLFSYLFSLKSIAVKIFMRKIFPAVVNSGNTKKALYPELSNLLIISTKDGYHGRRRLEVLQTLLSFGADPEYLVKDGPRGIPLVDAAKTGNLDAVKMLITAGSGINVYVPSYFGTALQAAVHSENLELVECLLGWGADVNVPHGPQYYVQIEKFGYSQYISEFKACAFKTPIQIACERNNIPLVEMLLAHGAPVDLCPLPQTIIDRSEWCVNDPPKYKETQFQTALQYSVTNRNIFLVRMLLSKRVNPDSTVIPNRGDTPLQMSVRLDYPEITEILIESGADVNAAPGRINGRTAMQAAAGSGNIQVAQILLSRNANINAPAGYSRGLTALQAAIRHGHPLMAGLLLMSGADINAPPAPIDGLTVIEAAAESGDLNMIKDLMRQGAILDSATAESAILDAISHQNLPMLKFLVEHATANKSDPEDESIPPIVAAVKLKWVDGVRHLLKMGADINASFYDEWEACENMNALNAAIMNGDTEMMELLLSNDANLQWSSSENPYNDALCHAVYRNSSQLVFLLLDKYSPSGSISFDPNVLAYAVDYTHNTTTIFETILNAISKLPKGLYGAHIWNAWDKLADKLDYISKYFAIKAAKLLVKAGAEINSKVGPADETLLQIAVGCGFFDMVEFLVRVGAYIQIPASRDVGTPLQEAIQAPRHQCAYLLLEHGADVNALPVEIGGVTALQAAARHGHKDLAVELLERGSDINAPPAKNCGVTALQAAAIKGHINIAIELLQRGAYVAAEAAPLNGRTAIDGAAEHGRENMLQLLLNHYDGDEDLKVVCERAAVWADREWHVEIARWLREYPGGSTESL
ncbi:uncharacterized protein TRUGW13939_10403 [Talaromyces rugulosus]|uniref:Uncharacterized protein n=1 Tax=Talaromyces rugulosus TaxID=121627 RepID=A0A7H8R9Y7_TALRU|nr:uncharacterized protein TRUGW13939_10403 [Talaromyces rugulosus]QKX63234.1 hypothetical protein TRUGW13939_10403 [Talaromyces rugulosus]